MRSSGLRRVLCSSLAVACWLCAHAALAQQLPSIDARTWRPSGDPRAGLVLEPTTTQGAGVLNVGTYVNYTLFPVTLRAPDSGDVKVRPVAHHVGMDLIAGLGLGSRAAVGVSMPLSLYQTGDDGLKSTVAATPVSTPAMGDLSIFGKVSILDNPNGGFGLGAIGVVSIPTGDAASFLSEGAPTVSLRALAEWSLVVAGAQISLGYKLRTENRTWPDASVGGITFGGEIPWSAGFWIKPDVFHIDRENRMKWELAAHGWVPAGPVLPFGAGTDPGSAQLSPVLVSLSDRIGLGHYQDAFLNFGAETSLTTAVGAPTLRLIAGAGWAPREHDKDHDGIEDDLDQCPDIPEDKDGFEDGDGCPEIDNDDDGIIDREDACPNVPGVKSADPKKNGCPAPDTDGDGIGDDVDACPTLKGVRSDDPKKNGCPAADRDNDGIPDYADKCPDQAEDIDGFEDTDGCPDPDDDGDGVPDKVDACPKVAGEPSTDPALNGCPSPDRDGDTYLNDADQCPDSAEVYNGVKDDDGCPDEGGKALVVFDGKKGSIKTATAIRLVSSASGVAIDPASLTTVRAIATELNHHHEWTLAVGARPTGNANDSLERALVLVTALTQMTHRDGAAETVSWDAVKRQPGAESGLGLLLLVAPVVPAATTPLQSTTAAPTNPALPTAPKK